MAIQRMVGVQVHDEAGYQTYRAQMTPLLEGAGGRFVVDVRVAEDAARRRGVDVDAELGPPPPDGHARRDLT